jgi:hypothetical protein
LHGRAAGCGRRSSRDKLQWMLSCDGFDEINYGERLLEKLEASSAAVLQ